MNVYLPIEVKVRELEGKALLAMIAAEKGHTVILGEKKDTLNLAQKRGVLPPGIVHDKSLTPGEYKIKSFTRLKELGHLITVQDEESGLLDESFDEFAKRRSSEETVSLADKIFAWGPHDGESLRRIYPDHSEKIISAGSPRVDFWRNELDEYYKDAASGMKDYILVASNFGFPIDENLFWDRVARLRKAGYFERDPSMEKYMYENTAYQYRLLHEFIVMIRHLSEVFPQKTILVRPHPVESIDAWHKLLGELPNVIIQRKDTISGWIRNAAVLIHNGCTSALEAAVSGLPRIAYRPIPHEIERAIPNNTSLHAFSLEELQTMVSDIFEKNQTEGIEEAENKSKAITDQRFSSLQGELAAEKIVNEWTQLAKTTGTPTSSPQELKDLKPVETVPLKVKAKRFAVRVRDTIFNPSKEVKGKSKLIKSTHKFPSLGDEEMADIVQRLRSTLGRFEDVDFTRYGKKSFIFSHKKNQGETR